MLARLQRILVLAIALGALAWALAWWPRQPGVAVLGALLVAGGYAVALAAEFLLLRHVGRADAALKPTAGELVLAWWSETVAACRVFGWRQPFRAQAVPDQLPRSPRRGVVFVHGFVCNRGLWTPWLERLRPDGRAFIALDLEPVFGAIDSYAPAIDEAIRRVTEATGQPPLLVCHSMGGLAARAWLRAAGDDTRVHRIVTIGTPHGGTWLGRFSRVRNGRQMRLDSDWLRELAAQETPSRRRRFVCWYSNCDNIVFPVRTATLPDADNRLLRGAAHVALAFQPVLVDAVLAELDR